MDCIKTLNKTAKRGNIWKLSMSVIIYLFIVINKMGCEYSSMGFPVWEMSASS